MAEAVSLEVSVRNSNRRTYTGLKAADFEVLDNGVRQEIVDVTFGKLPIDVTIALDVSYSVNGAMLDRLRRAVTQLMRDLGKEDRLKLMLFNARVNRVVDFTQDITVVEKALTTVAAGGGTTVYDTLSVAMVSASAPDRRQLVVCFTDGGDSNSATDPEVLVDVARRTRATVALVMPPLISGIEVRSFQPRTTTMIMPSARGPAAPLRDKLYATVVSETGGSRIGAGSSADLTQTFRAVLDDFRSAYVLYFRPKGVERAGFHTLAVKVNKSGANVLARKGYFGG
jgi:VWFA-related protein